MTSPKKTKVVFVTSSSFKVHENEVFCSECKLADGTPVCDVFEFDIRQVPIKEVLEVDINAMVMAEVTKAYTEIRVPCIVEHAGLIFDGHTSYPGGLTKPMWNALKDQFITETHSAGRKVVARAVVAYCDGKTVQTFVGETAGHLSDTPRGSREFYWDTVFIPDEAKGGAKDKTYAEIVDDPALGLAYKMREFSQSSRAMLKFLEYRRLNEPGLWPRQP